MVWSVGGIAAGMVSQKTSRTLVDEGSPRLTAVRFEGAGSRRGAFPDDGSDGSLRYTSGMLLSGKVADIGEQHMR